MAREDSQLKQNLVHWLTEVTRETNIAFGQISESIVCEGNSIGNGLALLARALGGLQQNSNSSYFNSNTTQMQCMQINIQMQCRQIFRMGQVQCKAATCLVSRIPQYRFFHLKSQVASSNDENLNSIIMEDNIQLQYSNINYAFHYLKHIPFYKS